VTKSYRIKGMTADSWSVDNYLRIDSGQILIDQEGTVVKTYTPARQQDREGMNRCRQCIYHVTQGKKGGKLGARKRYQLKQRGPIEVNNSICSSVVFAKVDTQE